MKLLDLGYQLGYYKAYHMHGKNVTIHLWCIPLILFSAIVLLGPLGIVWPLIGVYSIYYFLLDPFVACLAFPFLLGFGKVSDILQGSGLNVFLGVLAIHLIAWGAQFYGHFHFEHKAPAVFDNLVQPLVLAPYFVLFEVLFMLGFKKDLEREMFKQARIKRSSF